MMGLLLAVICLPALAAPLVMGRGTLSIVASRYAPYAALPVLLMAALPLEYPGLELRWLLLGARFGLDPIGRIFLVFSALLWVVSGVYARSYLEERGRRRFFAFYLLAMTGNLGLPIAADAASFYLFFAVMTFSGYGLVVHEGGAAARKAGRVYVGLAVVGEVFLLAGLMMAVHAAGSLLISGIPAAIAASSGAGTITGALLLGFAIKAGAVPLHVWLPLAHPVAPTPASAVLSGSMIKAGLLGWIRFLPLGETSLPGWGGAVITLGILAAFFGVVVGLLQTDPKTVLAYSSISQMGVINVGVGIALASSGAVVPAVGAVVLYAAHHGLAKGALFLGVGIVAANSGSSRRRGLVALGLLLPALAIAGAPLSSGSVAKGELKTLLPLAPGPWPIWLEWLLPLSAFATTLLMARFLVLTLAIGQPEKAHPLRVGMVVPWTVLLLAVASMIRLLPRFYPVGEGTSRYLPAPGALWLDVLPIAAGAMLFWLAVSGRRWIRKRGEPPVVAPGDLLIVVERAAASLRLPPILSRAVHTEPVALAADRWYQLYARSERDDLLLRLELALTRWAAAILLTLLVTAGLILILARAG